MKSTFEMIARIESEYAEPKDFEEFIEHLKIEHERHRLNKVTYDRLVEYSNEIYQNKGFNRDEN